MSASKPLRARSARGRAIPFDTSADAHDVQRDIYRRLGGRNRIAVTFRLNATMRRLAMSGILKRHPEYTETEARQAYARLRFGDALVRAMWPDRELVDP